TDPWHVKIAIEALQAGKHVFCQKPLTLTIEEGQLIRNACKKYKDQVFVVGTQQRAQKNQFATACLMVRKGMLGDIKRMTADIGGGDVGGPFKKQAAPENLDFNMWLGQCPTVEYIPERVHGNFRWWYEYSGGKFTDWGAHHIDFCQWALDEEKEGCGPISFNPITAEHPVPFKDGYPTIDDCYNTGHNFQISCKFPSGVEMIVCSNSRDGNGILIEGTKGRMHVDRGRIKGKPIEDGLHKQLTEDDFRELYNGKEYDEWHKRNFIACIREGGLPVSDVYSHVQAMNSCHLCAISARLGREIKWDPKAEKVVGDDQAASFIARERRKGFEIPVV
ncbi:MAG: Gfo/Idh/MocA family protein, partial [Thermoguttaceae bacterium]